MLSNSPGETLEPVTATRIGCESLPRLQAEALEHAAERGLDRARP